MKFIKDHLLQKAESLPHFIKLIEDNGMYIQYTGGIPTGVRDSDLKLHRFSKLGISIEDLHFLDQKARFTSMEERLRKLEQARNGQSLNPEIEH